MITTIHNRQSFLNCSCRICDSQQSIEEDLIDQLFNSSEKRLASFCGDFGKEGKPEPIVGKFSQTLAKMGTTRSRVSFFMNKFRKLGFVEYNRKLEVHNSLLTWFV